MKKTIIAYMLLFISINAFSQYQKSDRISSDVWNLHTKHTDSYQEYYENGIRMLNLSKTDEDRSLSLLHMGDAQIKTLNYASAIKLLTKGDKYAEKSHFYNVRSSINYLLSSAYRNAGLQQKADESWETAIKIAYATKDPDYEYMSQLGKALSLEGNLDYCKAIPFREKLVSLVQSQNERLGSISFREYINLSISYDLLSYDYLKCGQFEKAKAAFNHAEQLLETTLEENHHKISFHYMCKALLCIQANDTTSGAYWFSKASESAISRKETDLLKTIIQEALTNDIDISKNVKTYLDINAKGTDEIKKLVKSEIDFKNKQIEQKSNKINLILLFFCAVIALILLTAYVYHDRQRKRFQRIRSRFEAEKQKANEVFHFNEVDPIKSHDSAKPEKRIMSLENEKKLLKKLQLFEEGIKYTARDFTFSAFILALETNSKYANYILKQHRGKNFNDYINGLRIHFILERLCHDADYLSYKISYLAEISGFSSHSRFTKIFKDIVEISPSQFIRELSRSGTQTSINHTIKAEQ